MSDITNFNILYLIGFERSIGIVMVPGKYIQQVLVENLEYV